MSQDPLSKLSSTGKDFCQTTHHDTYAFIKPEQQDFCDKTVLITGASKGVGRAAALGFAKAGASKIALGARSDMSALEKEMAEAAKTAGRPAPKVLLLQLDVSDEASVESAKKSFETELGGSLDVLINNAGYLETFKRIGDADMKDWSQSYDVNLRATVLVTHAFLPLLLKGERKTVVNTSSVGAHMMLAGASAYQIAKLGLIRFGEFLNLEYADQGVISYAIHPGAVATELALRMPDPYHHVLIDTPELAGDTLVWLTAERREWLRGRYVDVGWDMEELLSKREKIEREELLKVRLAVGLSHK